MKAKHLCITTILCFIIIFYQHGIIYASSNTMLKEFSFYDIGAEDTIDSAKSKFDTNGFQCITGKETSLGISIIQKYRKVLGLSKKLEEIIAMDRDFADHGKDLAIKDMPIDVLGCNSPDNSPFEFSTSFFSVFNQKILALGIEIKEFEILRKRLTSKFGSCIQDGFCESENNILILVQKEAWYLHVYFIENLRLHHNNIKKQKAQKDKKLKEQINEAF